MSGVHMGVVAFAGFYVMFEIKGLSEYEARNFLVMLMVLFENLHVFNVRSESRPAFRIPLSNNWVLVGRSCAGASSPRAPTVSRSAYPRFTSAFSPQLGRRISTLTRPGRTASRRWKTQ